MPYWSRLYTRAELLLALLRVLDGTLHAAVVVPIYIRCYRLSFDEL